jgi:hypothetical protein
MEDSVPMSFVILPVAGISGAVFPLLRSIAMPHVLFPLTRVLSTVVKHSELSLVAGTKIFRVALVGIIPLEGVQVLFGLVHKRNSRSSTVPSLAIILMHDGWHHSVHDSSHSGSSRPGLELDDVPDVCMQELTSFGFAHYLILHVEGGCSKSLVFWNGTLSTASASHFVF